MFKWLSYGNYKESPHEINGVDSEYFPHREWSFTIDDIYIRYQSFKDKNDMISAIKKHQPHKIDIGAVFTGCPKDHKTIQPELFKPLERELVFDIDMTDYDDIRTCCKGAEICKKCWPYMTMAIRVVNRALKEDFSFKHMLWVFSGRRGVHCWVCDPEARQLPNDARAAIVDYLSVSTGSSENSDKKLKNTFTSIHPMIHKAYDILDTYFEKYIADESGQGLLSKDNFVKILNKLPNENIREELYDLWNKNPKITGAEKWRQIKVKTSADDNHQNLSSKKKRINYPELEAWRYELVFTHCYPRLDANVSKTQNHLLKSPFCVHPKTGKVCIPIDPNNPDAFDPFNVPTLKTLCHEVYNYSISHFFLIF